MKKALLFLVCCLGMVVGRAQTQVHINVDTIYFKDNYTADYSADTVSLVLKNVALAEWGGIHGLSMITENDTIKIKLCYWGSGSGGSVYYCNNSIPLGIFHSGIYNVNLFVGITYASNYDSCDNTIHRDTFDLSFSVFDMTGISDLQLTTYNFYLSPNPATDQLNISIDESLIGAQLNIYNTTGALVQSHQLNTPHSTLITSMLPAGIYIAEVITKEASVKKRWVKM